MRILKNSAAVIVGLAGMSFVVIIHELGHFFACKLFDVPTPVFSVGFGPILADYQIGQTIFQFCLLPLGGYVVISPEDLALVSYGKVVIIFLAGVVTNIACALPFLLRIPSQQTLPRQQEDDSRPRKSRGIIGPIGIIALVTKSVKQGPQAFARMLALISFNIGIFNLVPLPFLDGGKVLIHTLGLFFSLPADQVTGAVNLIIFALLIIFILFISLKDVLRLAR